MSEAPRALGPPPARGIIRSEPEDFVVEERLGFEPDGAGEHFLLFVEKRGANTHWVARSLAQFAGAGRVDVGYAGSKDRHAVARQWFSVRVGAKSNPDWSALRVEGVRVLRAERHGRKLRHGAHQGNTFRLCVRDVHGDEAALATRLRAVAARGVPNYYGPQRYGHDNLEQARALFAGARVPRVARGFALSAARSFLFDAVLAARVEDDSWHRLRAGDVANLAGSSSWFVVEQPDETLEARARDLDLHPTGPLWGRGEPPSRGEVSALEHAVADAHGELARGLEAAGLEQDRRALRAVPGGLEWELAGGELTLSFGLQPGEYATTVLRELIEVADRGGHDASDE